MAMNDLLQEHIDGLVQDCSNSSVLAIELLQSCTKPSRCTWHRQNMETLSALLALCEKNLLATGWFPSQRASNAELWCCPIGWYKQAAEQKSQVTGDLTCHDVHVTWL